MEAQLWLSFALGVAVGAVFTWIACRVRSAKTVREAQTRAAASEQARQSAAQQMQQARKQVDSLQGLLASRQRAAAPLPTATGAAASAAPRPSGVAAGAALPTFARAGHKPEPLDGLLASSGRDTIRKPGSEPKTGFADTQILS